MPSISSLADKPIDREARRARVARLDHLASKLDARFRIPGLGMRVGWDSILGLIPGVGDAATALPGAAMIYEAHRMGARKRTKARMAANSGVDLVLGSVPLIGDLFDVVFKSHLRNIRILKDELARIETQEEEKSAWPNDTDQKMEAATATGFSEKRVRLGSRAARAVHSNATSPRETNTNVPPKDRQVKRG